MSFGCKTILFHEGHHQDPHEKGPELKKQKNVEASVVKCLLVDVKTFQL